MLNLGKATTTAATLGQANTAAAGKAIQVTTLEAKTPKAQKTIQVNQDGQTNQGGRLAAAATYTRQMPSRIQKLTSTQQANKHATRLASKRASKRASKQANKHVKR
jgi:hypothetical protein